LISIESWHGAALVLLGVGLVEVKGVESGSCGGCVQASCLVVQSSRELVMVMVRRFDSVTDTSTNSCASGPFDPSNFLSGRYHT
jgi:hypothetical protein